MAGPSHSAQNPEMVPWVIRDFPHWTFLNDPCLEKGEVTPLCKGREVELGLQGFDPVEAQSEAKAENMTAFATDPIDSGYITFTPKLALP